MHLYFITRGQKLYVDDFITQLIGKYLPYKYRNPQTNQVEDKVLQLRLQPIQLWDVAFPEDSKDVVLNTILGSDKRIVGDPKMNSWLNKIKYWAMKLLKCEPVPDYATDKILPTGGPQHMSIMGIGVKKDAYIDGIEQI